MDYEKRYRNALEWARQVFNGKTGFIRKDVEEIFPELAESEDERVRKWLIAQLEIKSGSNDINRENMILKALTWLEKQGEQKPYGQREECFDCQFNYAGECKGSCAMKRGEQKPAWSEEDETVLNNLIYALANDRIGNNRDEYVDWLKSLRPQNRWKPSDEQLNNILDVLSFDNCTPKRRELLESLYEQLKKL